MERRSYRPAAGVLRWLSAAVMVALTLALTAAVMFFGTTGASGTGHSGQLGAAERFFTEGTNALSDAVPRVTPTPRQYRISGDGGAAAPKPDKACFGTAQTPGELDAVIDSAASLLDGETLYFSGSLPILDTYAIRYYRDETILAITWKQVVNNCVYSISEVKVADATQFRRYLAGGSYDSGKLLYATEMADTVNSVVAASGDYFRFRNAGVVVWNGTVCRAASGADTCYIDSRGDLSFTRSGELKDSAAAEDYVREHDIRFSIAFGPVLVENGELNSFGGYSLGEIDVPNTRAALCQMGQLHYLIVSAGSEGSHHNNHTMYEFAKHIRETGCRMAYALDGGQTAVHMFSGVLVNTPYYGAQRKISDIIYFATAIPNP